MATIETLPVISRMAFPRARPSKSLFLLFSVLVGAFCVWVLSLPLFPTEDGPIHLYFATVLSDLLNHSSPLYAQYYTVHHILPPYSVHYYLLILLMKAMSAPMAEKIVVCLIMATFAFGFRYLATGVGAAGDVLSLLIVGLLLNWPLGMGFENFSLSLGMACWALGCWARLQRPGGTATHIGVAPAPIRLAPARMRIAFVLVIALMTLTHPLPVLLVIGFGALDLALQVAASCFWKRESTAVFQRSWMLNLATYCAGACMLGYIYLFTDKKRVAHAAHEPIVPLGRLRSFFHLYRISYFGGFSISTSLYHGALYFIFLVGAFAGIITAVRQLRQQRWSSALSWVVAAFLITGALCILPDDLSGSHFVVDRLVIVIWLAALASGSGAERLPRYATYIVAASAICIAAGMLVMGQLYTRPVALRLASIEAAPIPVHGRVGLLMPANTMTYTFADHLQFYPAIWAGTYYFRQSGSVMLNTPWMDVSWLPLAGTPLMPTGEISFDDLESYQLLQRDLLRSPAVQQAVIPKIDMVIFAGPNTQLDRATIDPVLRLMPAAMQPCITQEWYTICPR